ncbi:MAG: c-type cytochrome, partial [Acidobacteriaceae bacterium]
GVKMTAMPAWPAQQRKDEIWAMVAFLRHLPDYNTTAFAAISGWNGRVGFLSDISPTAQVGNFNASDCARCHGFDGAGRNGTSPRIAGLGVQRFIQAMEGYRDGSKPSGFMQPVAAALTDRQIHQAAEFYSKLQTTEASSP